MATRLQKVPCRISLQDLALKKSEKTAICKDIELKFGNNRDQVWAYEFKNYNKFTI